MTKGARGELLRCNAKILHRLYQDKHTLCGHLLFVMFLWIQLSHYDTKWITIRKVELITLRIVYQNAVFALFSIARYTNSILTLWIVRAILFTTK